MTATYLRPELASTAVISNSSQLQHTTALREELGLEPGGTGLTGGHSGTLLPRRPAAAR